MTEQRNTSGGTRTGSDVAGGGAGDANAPSPVVTQADRDAAWRFRPEGYGPSDRANWDAGKYDYNPPIQAFARHRIAERERCAHMLDQKAASLEALGRATDNKQCLGAAREFSCFADYIRKGGQ